MQRGPEPAVPCPYCCLSTCSWSVSPLGRPCLALHSCLPSAESSLAGDCPLAILAQCPPPHDDSITASVRPSQLTSSREPSRRPGNRPQRSWRPGVGRRGRWVPGQASELLCVASVPAFVMRGGDHMIQKFPLLGIYLRLFFFFNLFIFGCVGSLFLCEGFL